MGARKPLYISDEHKRLREAVTAATDKASTTKERASRASWAKSNLLPPGPEQDALRYGRVHTKRETAAWEARLEALYALSDYLDVNSVEHHYPRRPSAKEPA